jgi:hypothetical protein
MTLNHTVHYHIENEVIVLVLVNLVMMKNHYLDYSMMMMEGFLFKLPKTKEYLLIRFKKK